MPPRPVQQQESGRGWHMNTVQGSRRSLLRCHMLRPGTNSGWRGLGVGARRYTSMPGPLTRSTRSMALGRCRMTSRRCSAVARACPTRLTAASRAVEEDLAVGVCSPPGMVRSNAASITGEGSNTGTDNGRKLLPVAVAASCALMTGNSRISCTMSIASRRSLTAP